MRINTWRVERRTHVISHLNGLINNFHLNRVQIGRFSHFYSETETGTGKLGRKDKIGYAGYQKRYNPIGSMSITIGNRYSKTGIRNHVTPLNIQLDTMVTTIYNIWTNRIS